MGDKKRRGHIDFHLYLPLQLYTKLRVVSEELNISMNDIVRYALYEYLRRFKIKVERSG